MPAISWAKKLAEANKAKAKAEREEEKAKRKEAWRIEKDRQEALKKSRLGVAARVILAGVSECFPDTEPFEYIRDKLRRSYGIVINYSSDLDEVVRKELGFKGTYNDYIEETYKELAEETGLDNPFA